MNNTIKKIIPFVLIATMLIAPSMSIVQACAVGTPRPTGNFYLYPPIPDLVSYTSSPDPPHLGQGTIGADVQLSSAIVMSYQVYPLPDIKTDYFYVQYLNIGSTISRLEEVFVQYNPAGMSLNQQRQLRLCIYDPVDFNIDGTINVLDLVLMLKAIQSGAVNSIFDVNHDGAVNFADLLIVTQFATRGIIVNQGGDSSGNIRLPWMDITAGVDLVNHYVYGFTSHFSGFGVH